LKNKPSVKEYKPDKILTISINVIIHGVINYQSGMNSWITHFKNLGFQNDRFIMRKVESIQIPKNNIVLLLFLWVGDYQFIRLISVPIL